MRRMPLTILELTKLRFAELNRVSPASITARSQIQDESATIAALGQDSGSAPAQATVLHSSCSDLL